MITDLQSTSMPVRGGDVVCSVFVVVLCVCMLCSVLVVVVCLYVALILYLL